MRRLAAALQRFVMRRAARLAGVRIYRVMVRDLARPVQGRDEGARGVTLLPLKPLDLLPCVADPALELDEGALRAAQARGESIVAAFDGTALAGYLWCATGPAPHTGEAWAGVPLGTVYLYRAFVRPEYRGRGIATTLFRRAEAGFLPARCERALACVELHNRASLNAMRSAGFRPNGRVATLQSGTRLFLWRSAAAARTGFRFSSLQDGKRGLSGRLAR